jgi:hypothetical protein
VEQSGRLPRVFCVVWEMERANNVRWMRITQVSQSGTSLISP